MCHHNKKNYISSIQVDEAEVVQEGAKVEAFTRYFDEIMGTPASSSVALDFLHLGVPSTDLSTLASYFSEEEVWETIKELPSDRAPSPDGSTGLFYKTAWPIIKQDVMRAFHALWSVDGRSFYLVNHAYMVLLKKKADASSVSDYQPISLVHSFAKRFTKVLARRLAPHLESLVCSNQSAFIKGRIIHDNFKAVELTAKCLHKRKSPTVLAKIDIAKAFDTVSWSYLLRIMRHMGFPQRWLNWISVCLASASTRIIINGSPSTRICHARGLRQGDPLSPMLFVIAMEGLN